MLGAAECMGFKVHLADFFPGHRSKTVVGVSPMQTAPGVLLKKNNFQSFAIFPGVMNNTYFDPFGPDHH